MSIKILHKGLVDSIQDIGRYGFQHLGIQPNGCMDLLSASLANSILQNDIHTKGNNQWFFFMVKNVPKGLTLKFNIVNFNKKYSLFDLGKKPYVFSMIRY